MQTQIENIPKRKRPGRPRKYSPEVVEVVRQRHAEGWSLRQNALAAQIPMSSLYRIVKSAPKVSA